MGAWPFKWGRWAGPLKGGVVQGVLVVGRVNVSDSEKGRGFARGPSPQEPPDWVSRGMGVASRRGGALPKWGTTPAS